MGERKRRLGDRRDGRRVRSLSPMQYVVPFIMKTRNDASNFFQSKVELGRVDNYIRKKRKEEGMNGLGFMHIMAAAYVRMCSQYPACNRFIAGQRIYQRGDIVLNMMVKKSMELNAQESSIKVTFSPDDDIYAVYEKMEKEIMKARETGDTNHFDVVARALQWMPTLIFRGFVSIITFLDYIDLMPNVIHRASPFHGTIFISNLGSLGIPPIYHHLYNFGNVPMFITFGTKYTVHEVALGGEVEKHRYIDYTAVSDERITDGHYLASAFKYLDWLFRHPDELDKAPETVIEDVD